MTSSALEADELCNSGVFEAILLQTLLDATQTMLAGSPPVCAVDV